MCSQFGDIYDESFFIDYLKADVRIVKELPDEMQSLDLEAIGSLVSPAAIPTFWSRVGDAMEFLTHESSIYLILALKICKMFVALCFEIELPVYLFKCSSQTWSDFDQTSVLCQRWCNS